MPTTFSANARLQKPGTSDRQWDLPINANTDALDAMTAIGSLVVTTTETPSTTLQVRIAPGSYAQSEGTVVQFAGQATVPVPASTTVYIWLDSTGAVVTGAAFPSTSHLRLAHVVTAATAVNQIVDERIQCRLTGSTPGFVHSAGDTMTGPLTIAAPATSGSVNPVLVADPVNRLIGFFGVTPGTQAPKLGTLTATPDAVVADTLADVGSSFTQSTLNNNFASLAAKVDGLITTLQRHGLMAS